MAVLTTKLTIAEYGRLTPPKDGWWELHHGELVKVTRPVFKHTWLQVTLSRLLTPIAGADWIVATEFPFRPAPEFEIWSADVAVVSWGRCKATGQDEWFAGSPELVIEVLSPSNTASEMLDREKTCMRGGCREFWILDPDLQLVKVSRADGHAATYEAGDGIPLNLFGGSTLAISTIFGG